MENNPEQPNYLNHVIFKTLHGSHLYGLQHAGSDLDLYVVHNAPPEKNEMGDIKKTNISQSIVDGIDATVLDWKTFHIQASSGVPQALEAMFSQKAEVDLIRAWRNSFYVSIPAMISTYSHAIEKFSNFEFKKRRHAVRYVLNLNEALANGGYFNPTLSQSDKELASQIAVSRSYVEELNALSPVQLNLNSNLIYEAMDKEGV